MQPTAVADVGGLLVLAGLLTGIDHDVQEVLALDATSLVVAEYLALRHEGAPDRTRSDFALVGRLVSEWYPVRAVAIDAAIAATDGGNSHNVDGLAALVLAEALRVPIVTKNRDLVSRAVAVLYC